MSNVRTWERTESDIKYEHDIFLLAKEVGHLVHITAKKYRSSYGDKLISMSTDAVVEAACVTKSYALTDEQIAFKLDHILKTESLLEGICVTIYVWLNILMDHDGISEITKKKLYSVEDRIGKFSGDAIVELEKKRWKMISMIKNDNFKMRATIK